MIRKAVVAGQFYPGSAQELERMISGFSPKVTSQVSAKGLILPHAGYIYSGKVAVDTVSRVLAKKRVIIFGTNHTGMGEDFSLWASGAWQTPLGTIPIDEDLAKRILEKAAPIKEDYLAHQGEHSIEVELPILDYFFKDFKFVPICCQMSSVKKYRRAGEQIFSAIKEIKEDVLLVASSDFTHYEPDSRARRNDRLALDKIIDLDEEGLVKVVAKERISMCGIAPVAILICCLKNLGAKKASVALYQTSAEASGDYSAVVGYAGVIIK